MVAEAQRARLRERGSVSAAVRRFLAPIEPWYDWGNDREIIRLDSHCADFADESSAPVKFLTLQWLGLHLDVSFGRTRRKIGEAEIVENRAAIARLRARREEADGE